MSFAPNLRERPDRIGGRDYFRRQTPIEKWKLRLTLLAMLLTMLWLAWGFARPGFGVDRYSHGELAHVHAMWDLKCEACHEPYQPINENTWLHDLLAGGSDPNRWRNVKCQSCHAGPPHHPNVRPESENAVACGGCHRDHRGRDASLVRLADADCARCHRDLTPHAVDPSAMTVQKTITSFTDATPNRGHPEFRPLAEFDPERDRGLKFSHAVHMSPGIKYMEGQARWLTYDKLPEDAARRYLKQLGVEGDFANLGAKDVQLTCAACHQLDTTDVTFTDAELAGLPLDALRMPRQPGAYYQPIVFEKHCASCHPLTFEKVDAKTTRSIPHRLQPAQIDEQLKLMYTAEFLQKNPRWLKRPLPPRDRLDARSDDPIAHTHHDAINRQVDDARAMILSSRTCLQCHEQSDDLTIRPTRIPSVYYARAKFDHAVHRAADCRICHEGKYAPLSDTLIEREKLDLPGIDNCRTCHAPATTRGGGARFDCTECHLYHDGGQRHWLAGPGSIRRDPDEKFDNLLRFLRGDTSPGKSKN